MTSAAEWERHARWWQEGFSDGADVEYREQILPIASELLSGCQRVLDVGTGEGQLARLLLEQGADFVVGIDRSLGQIREAAARSDGRRWMLQADAQALPFRSRYFDGVVACLVLDHVPDLGRAFADIAEVLEPGGRFVILTNHPLLQTPGSGWIDDQILDPPEQYWRVGPYLEELSEVDEVEPGVHITFFHRTISTYVNLLVEHGFDLQQMLEPPPPEGFLAAAPEYRDASRIPRLLAMLLERRPH